MSWWEREEPEEEPEEERREEPEEEPEGGLKTETLHNGFHLPVFVPALPPCSASCWSQRHTAAVNIQSASLICKWADYVSK